MCIVNIANNHDMSMEEARQKMIELYDKNVHGKFPDTSAITESFDGKVGRWLEVQLGVKPNAANEPDIYGIEVKTDTKSALTLGSWDPNYWIFLDEEYGITRDDFMKIFGHERPPPEGIIDKIIRIFRKEYSWSGKPVPRYFNGGLSNKFGVRIEIDGSNNISFVYSYTDDKRHKKSSIVPKDLQDADFTIARWDADYDESRYNAPNMKKGLRRKVEDKYSINGWCRCFRSTQENGELGAYSSIGFMDPMTFETFMGHFKTGDFYFDCGMHQSEKGNTRNYCQWRVRNRFLDSLIVSRHP